MVRVALLSTIEAVARAGGDPRAFLPLAGRMVVQYQLESALAMGCERIACHAVGLPRELVALQHQAEKAGAQFQVIHDNRALSGMVRAADEIVVFADSLVIDQELALAALSNRPGILVFPAEEGVAAGYERIDRDYAWAGVFIAPGSTVERLADLPHDADPVSSLLRIALQSGVRPRPMPAGSLASHNWGLIQSAEDAENFEQHWLGRHARRAPYYAPFLALADRAAIALVAFGPDVARKYGRIFGLSGAMGLAAGLAGWFWSPVAALVLACGAFLAGRVAGSMREIALAGRHQRTESHLTQRGFELFYDILLLLVTLLAAPEAERSAVLLGMASVLLLLRLGRGLPLRKWKILLEDRPFLAAGLAAASFTDDIVIVLQILVLAIVTAMLLDNVRPRLTQT